MLYRPSSPKKLWDCTLYCANGTYHIFYLSSGNLGHVCTRDFVQYTELPDIEGFGVPGAWNERGLFLTGCIVPVGTGYKMLLGTIEPSTQRQVYGLYTSDDLIHWTQYEHNPVLFADGVLYDDAYSPRDGGMYTAWRDPQVYRIEDGWYYLCLCARLKEHADDSTGAAIANVRTRDFIRYEYLPPLSEVGHLVKYAECPDCFSFRGDEYLTFLDHGWGGNAIHTLSVKGAAGTFYQIRRRGDAAYETPRDFLLLGSSDDRQCGWAARTALSADGQRILYYHVTAENSSFGIPKLIRRNPSGSLRLQFFPAMRALIGEPIGYGFEKNFAGDTGSWVPSSDRTIAGSAKEYGSAKPLCETGAFVLECVLQIERGKRAGISLWQTPENEAVSVTFDCETQSVRCENLYYTPCEGFGYAAGDIVNGGKVRECDRRAFRIRYGKAYSLKLFARDKTVDFYIDDTWIFCKRFPEAADHGTLSLFVSRAAAEFRDIRISSFRGQS